jgi:hypothetical protein
MRELGISNQEITGFTSKWYTQGVPKNLALPKLANEPLGAVGIPTTTLPGVAAVLENSTVVYIIRAPKDVAIKVPDWGWRWKTNGFFLKRSQENTLLILSPHRSFPHWVSTVPGN